MVTKFDYFVFLSIVIWLTILSLYSIVYVYSVVKENPTTLFTIAAELTLMIIEFFVTLGYPIIFYFFYKFSFALSGVLGAVGYSTVAAFFISSISPIQGDGTLGRTLIGINSSISAQV